MRYKDGGLLDNEGARTPFEQYVFSTDDKMAHVAKLKSGNKNRKSSKTSARNAEIGIDLSSLHSVLICPKHLRMLSVAIVAATQPKR